MIRKILLVMVMVLGICSGAVASRIDSNANVVVMDFGTHPDAVPIDINVINAGKAAHEYLLQRLILSDKMTVADRSLVEEKIQAENINTTGLINPDDARKIAKLLGAKYIIYGNVNDVTLSEVGTKVLVGGVNVCTVKSHIIARVMDVDTGEIISAAKGEGKSKSSFVKVKGGPVAVVSVGNTKVTQDSVHNAIQQAAFQTADVLITNLYGETPNAGRK